jgi:hypothetical protein
VAKPTLQPFQERVVEEQKALDDKIGRLIDFLRGPVFQELPRTEQNRLHIQLIFMQGYDTILAQRIEAFHG